MFANIDTSILWIYCKDCKDCKDVRRVKETTTK